MMFCIQPCTVEFSIPIVVGEDRLRETGDVYKRQINKRTFSIENHHYGVYREPSKVSSCVVTTQGLAQSTDQHQISYFMYEVCKHEIWEVGGSGS